MDREHRAASQLAVWIGSILVVSAIPLVNFYAIPLMAVGGVGYIAFTTATPWLRKRPRVSRRDRSDATRKHQDQEQRTRWIETLQSAHAPLRENKTDL